jgi:hypothetical protein
VGLGTLFFAIFEGGLGGGSRYGEHRCGERR